MQLEAIIRETQPVAITGDPHVEALGVACDSRCVRPGYLFVAIAGGSHDGWSFVDDAVKRGAVGIVSERAVAPRNGASLKGGRSAPPGPESIRGVCHIQVKDAREAVAILACIFNNRPSTRLKTIGITGTNGKTTTAYIIREILDARGLSPGSLTTVEYRIRDRVIPATRTTPDATVLQSMLAAMADAGCKSAVMEVSSHALIQKRTFGIDYDAVVFTNLTREHLDYHETMEAYFEAKSMLFAPVGGRGKRMMRVINLDDAWGRRLSDSLGAEADRLTYGVVQDAQVRALDIELAPEGGVFRARTPWGVSTIKTQLLGRFNIGNILAAIAACGSLGVELDLMARVIPRVVCAPGRLELINADGNPRVFVDYAHTDDALSQTLAALKEIARSRIILVFGCGGDRDRTKRSAMGQTAARLADYSIITSDNPRSEDPLEIIAEIRRGFGAAQNFSVVADRGEAIRRALELARGDDVVLIAGKGHETFQEIANRSIPFDDRQFAKECIRAMR